MSRRFQRGGSAWTFLKDYILQIILKHGQLAYLKGHLDLFCVTIRIRNRYF
jgi:hypothetical protein